MEQECNICLTECNICLTEYDCSQGREIKIIIGLKKMCQQSHVFVYKLYNKVALIYQIVLTFCRH